MLSVEISFTAPSRFRSMSASIVDYRDQMISPNIESLYITLSAEAVQTASIETAGTSSYPREFITL